MSLGKAVPQYVSKSCRALARRNNMFKEICFKVEIVMINSLAVDGKKHSQGKSDVLIIWHATSLPLLGTCQSIKHCTKCDICTKKERLYPSPLPMMQSDVMICWYKLRISIDVSTGGVAAGECIVQWQYDLRHDTIKTFFVDLFCSFLKGQGYTCKCQGEGNLAKNAVFGHFSYPHRKNFN